MNDTPDLLTEADANPTTASIRSLLKKKYAPPEWALMEEVAPSTGGGTGYADAVAVNLWRSGGHAIHGHEIKSSRSDWLRELKQPGKADPVMVYCDFWWLVAPRDIAHESEIPLTWGWMVPTTTGLRVARKAQRLQPKALDRAFFASLVRRGFESSMSIASELVADELQRVRTESQKAIDDSVERRTKEIRREMSDLHGHLEKLKKHTGIEVSRYTGVDADMVKMAIALTRWSRGGQPFELSRLLTIAAQLEGAAATVRTACESFAAPVSAAEPR